MEGRGIPSGARRARRIRPILAAAAALVILTAGLAAGLLVLRPWNEPPLPPERSTAVERALDWLELAQEPSGGFRAGRWGGNSLYDVGLTGLVTLALLNGSTGDWEESGRLPGPVSRAVSHLMAIQSSRGVFGPEFRGTPYNHGIATVALLETYGITRRPGLKEPIDRAISFIRKTQNGGGGWGYLENEPEANTAVTCWPLQALLIARALGWSGLDASIAGGFAHLERVLDRSGRAGYSRRGEFPYGPEGLSSMGAACVILDRTGAKFPESARRRLLDEVVRASAAPLEGDLYRDFFLSFAVRGIPGMAAGDWASRARDSLTATQVRAGPHRGSWEPDDRWAPVGGRLYSTAMATLILEADRRGSRIASWMGQNG